MSVETERDNLNKIGASSLSCLRDMVAALDCDYDRLEELRQTRSDWMDFEIESTTGAARVWEEVQPNEASELEALEAEAGECTSREDAEQRIHEDALSVEVRSGWVSSKAEMEPEEFMILLTTGGPAVRILGELRDGEPYRAWLQVQDWGTPWTDYYEDGVAGVCLACARCFCFES